jgi:PucR family transcriptional regulator, proline-responsive transcriptional activator
MSLSVESVYNSIKNKYKLTLIAGRKGINRVISWIYYTEDPSTIEYIRGGELAITLGVNFERQQDNKGDESENLTQFLKTYIDNFQTHNASGLIINTGKYIHEIPQKIIALCDELSFPLFIMPWEIHTIDVMQEVGNMLATDRQNAFSVENFFYTAIFTPESADQNQILNTPFHDAHEFAVVLLEIEMKRFNNDIEQIKRYVTFSFNPKLSLPVNSYASFVHNQKVIYILKEHFEKSAYEIACIAANDKYFYGKKTSISDSCRNQKELPDMYNHALYAMELTDSVNSVSRYDSLGLFKILVEVKNRKVLEQMYEDTLGKLRVFAEDKRADYMKTLELYLKYGGNIQKISDENASHRNTVVYRIHKIEETLGMDLSDGDNRSLVQTALYIKKFLDKKL